MTEEEWFALLDCPSLGRLQLLEGTHGMSLSPRKLRLYVAACARRIWCHFEDPRCRTAIEVAERFADGRASKRQFRIACNEAQKALFEMDEAAEHESPAECALELAGWGCNLRIYARAADHAAAWARLAVLGKRLYTEDNAAYWKADEQELQTHADLTRELFGNPFRPVALEPAWRTSGVLALAGAAYEERSLPSGTLHPDRLAVLADALEDAGCTDAELLGHLRSEGPHVRGCWAVDLILGKD